MATFNANLGSASRKANLGRTKMRFSDERKGIFRCFNSNKPSKANMERERVKQFSIYQKEVEQSQDKEYRKRRRERDAVRKVKRTQTKCIRRLLIPTVVFLCSGVGITLAGMMPGVGKGTFLEKHKTILLTVGPICLVLGILALMVSEALVRRETKNKEYVAAEINSMYQENKDAIKQEPYELFYYYNSALAKAASENTSFIHQLQLNKLTVDSESGNSILDPSLRNALMTGSYRPGPAVSTTTIETQTDDQLLWTYLQSHIELDSSGSWKSKKKVCAMESVDSQYSMASAYTQYTEISEELGEDDIEEDISDDEPLLRFTPPKCDPSYPLIKVELHSSKGKITEPQTSAMKSDQIPTITMEGPGPHDVYFETNQAEIPKSQQSSNIPSITLTQPRISNSGTIGGQHLLPLTSPVNTSVPNLLQGLPPEIGIAPSPRRASWTTFE